MSGAIEIATLILEQLPKAVEGLCAAFGYKVVTLEIAPIDSGPVDRMDAARDQATKRVRFVHDPDIPPDTEKP